MDPSRGDSRYNLNYSMSSIGLTLADQADMYNNPAAVAAIGGRPPSTGLLQSMGGVGSGASGGLLPRSAVNLMSNAQCQSLNNTNSSGQSNNQQRGLKRAGSDCYDESHLRVGTAGISSLQSLDNCGASSNVQHNTQQQQPQSSGSGGVQDIVDDNYNTMQNKKSPPANGKKTKGRVKIKMEYIDNKLRRYTTFSKRKTGIMKKAYELSTLTGTQVMLLVASETGHVYTFATRKLQPMITSEAGKQLIQTCLNSPDPPSVGGGDQRMSATGFEETELSYNIADEDSKEMRSPLSSAINSEESSDIEGAANVNNYDFVHNQDPQTVDSVDIKANICKKSSNDTSEHIQGDATAGKVENNQGSNHHHKDGSVKRKGLTSSENGICSPPDLSNVPQSVLLQLIQAGHLQVHTEEDGSGHQYVAIPLHPSTVDRLQTTNPNVNNRQTQPDRRRDHSPCKQSNMQTPSELTIKK